MSLDTNFDRDEQWPFLGREHTKLLRGSAISFEVASERGYKTENTKSRLLGLGFGKYQARVPALLIPLFDVHGESAGAQLRPDEPRTVNGRISKYEIPRRMGMVIDVHPRLTRKRANPHQTSPDQPAELVPLIADPAIPLLVTEGTKKSDAAVSIELCCIALLGVWCWRGTNEAGGSTALADFESIALKNRDVYLAFDSDVMKNRAVHAAMARLKNFLESRGAAVHLVYLPAGTHARKVGLDDWIRDQRELGLTDEQIRGALFALATDVLRLPIFESSPGIPAGFRLDAEGVWFLVEPRDGGEPSWNRICSPIEIVALTRGTGGEQWGRLARFKDPDGRQHEWAIPMELLADNGATYRSRLLDMGLEIAPTISARNAVYEYISRSQPPQRVRAVTRPGWGGTNIFVLPDRAIGGDEGGERVLWQSRFAIDHAFNVKGTLEEWQSHVAALCPGNSRLAFSVSSSFTSPLLALVDSESFGFNLVGPSSLGKTTVARCAGSAWGGSDSDAGYLRAWRSTANALEATATLHNDSLLVLDEVAQVDAREAGAVVYMLCNGSGKGRLRRDGSGRPIATWRLVLLSTGEITFSDKVAEDNRRRATAGQQVRVIDIPADAGAGHGIFENLHDAGSGYELANRLKAAAVNHYGTAIRVFLEELIAEPSAVETVRAHLHEWKAENCPSSANYQVERVASRFGLVAAAGELAIAFGVLPWGEGEADRAATTCFKAWLERRGHTGAADIEAGIAAVRKFLELHGESRFHPAWEPPTDKNGNGIDRPTLNRAGFRRKRTDAADASEFYVLPEVWRTEVLAGFDAPAINKELIARELLLVNSDKKAASLVRVPGFGVKRLHHLSPSILTDADTESSREETEKPIEDAVTEQGEVQP